MRVGFTGTQIGMSSAQKNELYAFLRKAKSMDGEVEFHHGDCIGADTEAHDIAMLAGCDIIIHPPTNPKKRSFCQNFKRRANPLPYLERNKHIVDATTVLIVAPKSDVEELRSGTWATYRYAKSRGGMIILLGRNEPRSNLE
jgi:hypothetical protein